MVMQPDWQIDETVEALSRIDRNDLTEIFQQFLLLKEETAKIEKQEKSLRKKLDKLNDMKSRMEYLFYISYLRDIPFKGLESETERGFTLRHLGYAPYEKAIIKLGEEKGWK